MQKRVGSQEFHRAALEAARESITLLKNKNNLLPLTKGKKILVVGPNADRLSALNGGWSGTWQGNKESAYPKEKDTILEAIRKKFGAVSGLTIKEADVIVACLGEPAEHLEKKLKRTIPPR